MQTGRLLFQSFFKFRFLSNQQQQQYFSTLRKTKQNWSRTGAVLAPVCILSFGLFATIHEVRKEKSDNKLSESATIEMSPSDKSKEGSKETSLKTIHSYSRFSSFASIQVTKMVMISGS